MRANHVVVVDDDWRVRQSLRNVVESAGLRCLTFASGREFLDSGQLETAGCVILDVRMPGIGGLELQHQIRRQRPLLPVLFISAHDDDATRRRALAGGAVDFLCKPFDADHLLRALDRELMPRTTEGEQE